MRKPVCKKGKPCKGICIPRSHECSDTPTPVSAGAINSKLRQVEDGIRGQPVEYAYIMDPRTGKTTGPIGGSDPRMVSIPSGLAKGAIVTHNHPVPPELSSVPEYQKGFGLSRGDIVNSVAQGCAEIRAVTPGHTYSMKFSAEKSGGLRNMVAASRAYESAKRTIESDFGAKIRMGQITIERANADYHHEVARLMASDMGFDYKRIDIHRDSEVEREDAVKKGRRCGKGFVSFKKKCKSNRGPSKEGWKPDRENLLTAAKVLGGAVAVYTIVDHARFEMMYRDGGEPKGTMKREIIEKKLKVLEDGIRNKDYESLYCLDPVTGKKVIGPHSDKNRAQVSIPNVDSGVWKGKILTHNHPTKTVGGASLSFSPPDIRVAGCLGLAEIRAVTKRHNYSMRFPEGSVGGLIRGLEMEHKYKQYADQRIGPLLKQVYSGQISVADANEQALHGASEDLAKEYGFIYKREVVSPPQKERGRIYGGVTAPPLRQDSWDFEHLDAVRKGKKCGKGYIPARHKCRSGLGQAARQAVASLPGGMDAGRAQLISDSKNILGRDKTSRLRAAGIGVGAAIGGLGIAAALTGVHVKAELARSAIDFNSIRQPPGGVPDEQTLKKYDTFKEGDVIRKVFKKGIGARHHYGIYVGKDPKTGEHMLIDLAENWKTRSNTPFIQRRGLNWNASPTDTEWEAVPEEEINERIEAGLGQRFSGKEIVARAESLLGAELTYKGFDSNCDSFAWVVATGSPVAQQSRGLSPLTRFISGAVTDTMLSIEVESQFFPGGNVKAGTKIGPFKVTGRTYYAKSKNRMTTRQMADFLAQQRALDVRRTLWEGIRNPYTGVVENPDAPQIRPGETVAVARAEKPPIRYEEMLTYMQDEYNSMILADTYRKTEQDKLKTDSPESDLDELLTALGIATPSQFEAKVNTLLGEIGGTSATLRRHHLYKSYLMLVLAMVNQLHGGSLTGEMERGDAKGKKCGKGFIPFRLKCRKGAAALSKGLLQKRRGVVAMGAIAASGAIVAAGGFMALRSISRDVKASSIDPSLYRFTEDGKPDEDALAEYDGFRPGDVIRNSFKRVGGYSNHYAIYAGKDKRTGEHLAYSVAVGGPQKSQVTLLPLHSRPDKGKSMYQRVPDDELKPSKGERYSRLETVRRANELTGKTLRYNMLRDNCEHWARAVATGEKYSAQARESKVGRVSTVASDILSAVSSRLDPVTSTANQESTETMLNSLKRLEMQRQHGSMGSGPRFVLAENFSFQPSIYMPLAGNKIDIKSEIKPSIGSPQVDIKANVSATGTVSPTASFASNITGINRGGAGGGKSEGGGGPKALIENINLNPKVSFPGGGNEANISFNFSPSILSPKVEGSPTAAANFSALSPSLSGKVDLLGADLAKVDVGKLIPNPFAKKSKSGESKSDSEESDLLSQVVDAIGLKHPDEFESGLDAISEPFGTSGRFFKEECLRNYFMMLGLGIHFLAQEGKTGREDAVAGKVQEGAIARTLVRVLARSYTDGVDRILSIRAKGNVLYGHFLGDGKIIAYQLDLEKDQVSTQIAKDRRDTARLDGIREEVERLDAVRRKSSRRQCSIGLSCGGTCISRTKACKVSLNRLSSPMERASLKEGLRLFQDPVPLGTGPVPQEVGTPRYASPADNPNAGIRELKLAAQERGVYRYGAMNKSELRNAIRAVDENPQQNERIRRSIERKQEAKRVTEGSRFADYAEDWIKAKKIMRIAGTGGPLAIAAAGAWVIGSTRREYNRAVDDYRSGFQDSARQATSMAAKLPSERIYQPNMMFVVGGYTAEKGSVSKIRQAFDRAAQEEGDSGGWFNRENHIFEFSLNASDIPLPKGVRRRNKEGYTDEYIGYLGRQAAMGTIFPKGIKGKLIKEAAGLKGGRNEDAVRLAAQIYAQARHSEPRQEKLEDKTNAELRKELTKYGVRADPRETKSTLISRLYDIGAGDEEFVNGNLPINIVAYGGGGHAAREAMEILSRMEGGRDILDRINLATISTPDFGFTKQIASEVSLRSRHDPLTETLPTRAERTVNTVRSRELEDYLGDREVTNIIRQHFGYERTSAFQRELERRRTRQRLLDLQDQEERRQAILRERNANRRAARQSPQAQASPAPQQQTQANPSPQQQAQATPSFGSRPRARRRNNPAPTPAPNP